MHTWTGLLAQTCIWSCHIFPAFCSGGLCLPSLSNSHMVNTWKFSWHLLSVCAFLQVCCFFLILDERLSMPNTCCFYLHQFRKDNWAFFPSPVPGQPFLPIVSNPTVPFCSVVMNQIRKVTQVKCYASLQVIFIRVTSQPCSIYRHIKICLGTAEEAEERQGWMSCHHKLMATAEVMAYQ